MYYLEAVFRDKVLGLLMDALPNAPLQTLWDI